MPAALHAVQGLGGAGLGVWLRADRQTIVVLGVVEKDGSAYSLPVQLEPNRWKRVEEPFASLTLSSDSRDENGRLDLDQAATLIVADACGFLPGATGPRTLWIEDYHVVSAMRPRPLQAYQSMLELGPPSPSGARVTGGVRYLPAHFGTGVLSDRPGQLAVVPLQSTGRPQWRMEQGSIEAWISPQFDMPAVRDFSALFAMQEEPFVPGLKGSLLVFYTRTRQLAVQFNGSLETTLGTRVLSWKRGEQHHLAVTWGPAGMRIYLDGRLEGTKSYSAGPARPTADLVVGGHAMTTLGHRYGDTLIDDLRISRRQRSDAEILATATATRPVADDADTVALERFDGAPQPPLRVQGATRPWNSTSPGGAWHFTLAGSAIRSGDRFRAVLSDAAGRVMRRWNPSGAVLSGRGPETPGLYSVAVDQLRGGVTVNHGTGWLLVTDPHPAHDPFFGASACFADPEDDESYFAQAAAAGVTMLRMPFEWAEIEPREGQYDWSRYDRITAWARRHGVDLVPTFIWENPQPAWAGPTTVHSGDQDLRYPPSDMARWSRFVSAVVARYRTTVHWWIAANEPNLARYWASEANPTAYTALLKVTRQAILKSDPRARVLGINTGGVDLLFAGECMKLGALADCDAVGVHPYICPHDPDERIPVNILDPNSMVGTFGQALEAVHRLTVTHGRPRQLWLDEAGQPYREDFAATDWGVPELQAAWMLTKLMVEARASGVVDRVLWFSFRGGEYGSFALVRPDGSPSLPLASYIAAVRLLGGTRPAGRLGRSPGMETRRFRGARGTVQVVWRKTGSGRLALAAGERALDVYGMTLAARGSITVGRQPVYIIGR